jgi:nucleotidyltransferase/DNA polymerase involved in DNA repair
MFFIAMASACFNPSRFLSLWLRVLLGITSSVEAVSCDEAFLFVRTSDPETIIRRIREEVLKASGCVCSIGCSDSGKLIARMATRSAKPNGFRVVDSAVVPIQDFLDPLPVGDIPGVGYSTKQKLQAAGLNLCRNIRLCSAETVKSLLGPALGLKLHRICCGIDTLPIGADLTNSGECSNTGRIKDSIGVQMSWGVRLSSIPHVHIFFRCLAVELCTRAANAKVRGSLLTLKLWIKSDGAPEAKKHMGHGICYQVSKSGALPQLSTEATVNHVMPVVIACFDKCIAGIRTLTAEDIRGVGITMSRLQLSSDIPVVQPVKFARNQDPVELIRSSHQPPLSFSLMPPPQVSKVLRTASDSSPVKRTPQSPLQNAYRSVLAPAEKRHMRELPISSSQLDHNVLAALSPELRRQVQDDAEKISALKRQNREFNRRSTFSVQVLEHDNHIQVTNSCIRPEDLSCHVFVEASSTGNSALVEALQMKHSIADWMALGPPAASDVKLVGGIIRSLVAARFMDSLRSFLLALARCAHSFEAADERRRIWVEWVGRAIEFAQKKIFAEHGALCLL